MRIPIVEAVAGDTIRFTFVSSGDTASPISSALYEGTETLISSITATSSGNGFYYASMSIPSSHPWLVNEWRATVNSVAQVSRQMVRVSRMEVD
jgi:hypothetical protein